MYPFFSFFQLFWFSSFAPYFQQICNNWSVLTNDGWYKMDKFSSLINFLTVIFFSCFFYYFIFFILFFLLLLLLIKAIILQYLATSSVFKNRN